MNLLADFIGLLGVALILLAYAAIQFKRMEASDRRYSLLNLAGALLILVSLTVDFNLSAIVMESAWAVISLYGLFRRREET
jgi:hypothetical protein